MAREGLDVLLVSMPFAHLRSPSLALGLFKQTLVGRGISCEVLYPTFRFARLIGVELYDRIGNGFPDFLGLVGEWIFSDKPSDPAVYGEYLRERFGTGRRPDEMDAFIRGCAAARTQVAEFVDEVATDILGRHPRIVALTSTFQQHLASIRLAGELRRRDPALVLVIGGANCEGPMGRETARSFPVFDAVAVGEADASFPAYVADVLAGRRRPADEPCAILSGEGQPSTDLNALPVPDYSDYARALRDAGLVNAAEISIPFETSRGCWWGEKQHCTFCGLNGSTMKFRSKEPDRVLAEIDALIETYRPETLSAVDNILDAGYVKSVLPRLAERRRAGGQPVSLFYEVKSNISLAGLKAAAEAGITDLQPGIESFSTNVLKLMRKGVTAVQNVQFLKQCRQVGIHAHWHLLYGFPGESAADYDEMVALAPLLTHFDPPLNCSRIRLDRFSPNFFDADRYGFSNVRPGASYGFVYDLPVGNVRELAYFFDYDAANDHPEVYGRLWATFRAWRAGHAGAALTRFDRGGETVVLDSRTAERPRCLYLTPSQARVLAELDAAVPAARWRAEAGNGLDADLAVLVEHGLVVELDGRLLSLVLASPDPPARSVWRHPIVLLGARRAA